MTGREASFFEVNLEMTTLTLRWRSMATVASPFPAVSTPYLHAFAVVPTRTG